MNIVFPIVQTKDTIYDGHNIHYFLLVNIHEQCMNIHNELMNIHAHEYY
jgi:hypothetical protein